MAVLSKLSADYTCYELGHTWTPYCTQAWKDIARSSYPESFKIYLPLYIVAALLQKKGKYYIFFKLLPEVLQSSVFLGTNAFLFIFTFCIWRAWQQNFNMLSAGYIPGFIASFLAINLERKGRRGVLAVYMANIAVETLYLMLKSRGIVKPIPYGEVLLFSLASSVFMYLKSTDQLYGVVKSLMSFLLGNDVHLNVNNQTKGLISFLPMSVERLIQKLRSRLSVSSSLSLLYDCFTHSFMAASRMFAFGWGISAILKVITSIRWLIRRPRTLFEAVCHGDNFRLAAFLSSYVAILKIASRCLRRSSCHQSNDNDEFEQLGAVKSALCGALAGLSMLWYRSSTLALYLLSKALEVIVMQAVRLGTLPSIPHADKILYTLATALVFHAGVVEPHNLRIAYFKFLMRLTNGRFVELNRVLLDELGTHASSSFPSLWPNYDIRFTRLAAGPHMVGFRAS